MSVCDKLTGEQSLNMLLEVENTPELLEPTFGERRLPLWAIMRDPFLEVIVGQYLKIDFVGPKIKKNKCDIGKRLFFTFRSLAYNLRSLARKNYNCPIVIVATGARVKLIDGKYFNCLSDHFASLYGNQTLVLEDLFEWKWPFPRHFKNVLIHTPLLALASIQSLLLGDDCQQQIRKMIQMVCSRARALFGYEIDITIQRWLLQTTCRAAASFPSRYLYYHSLFKIMNARVLLKEDASYGGIDNIAAITAANDLNMVTAEYQHGLVYAEHHAYNYAPVISSSANYRRTLPQNFLAWGPWFIERTRIPVKMHSVGYPHRDSVCGEIIRSDTNRSNILVLGNGINTELFLALCQDIQNLLKSHYQVLFRPHPLERYKAISPITNATYPDVKIDTRDDIYAAFSDTAVLIGEASTAQFEAVGIVPMIFRWDTAAARYAFQDSPFPKFNSASDLARMIESPALYRAPVTLTSNMWQNNWKEHYEDFISSAINS
jgi:hypothetical protein